MSAMALDSKAMLTSYGARGVCSVVGLACEFSTIHVSILELLKSQRGVCEAELDWLDNFVYWAGHREGITGCRTDRRAPMHVQSIRWCI